MTFVHPLVFILIIPLTYLLYILFKPLQSGVSPLFSQKTYEKLFVSRGAYKNLRLISLWFCGFFMIMALARPVLPPQASTITQEGYDIIIALDLSHSMSAKDLTPSRFEASKEKILSLIKAYPLHRFGVIGFTSHPFVISPLTDDTETLLYLMDSLDYKTIVSKGTNLAGAIKLGSKLSKASKKIMVIFSDGGDNENFNQEIALAQSNAMSLYLITTATPQGSTLLDEENHIIKDKQGHIVLSTIHPDSDILTQKTGGITVGFTQGSGDIQSVMSHIVSHLKPLATTQQTMYNKREFFIYPLTLSVIFLFVALFKIPSRLISPLLIISFLLPLHGGVLDFQDIKQGRTLYNQGKFEEAITPFESLVASHPTPQALYNLANCYYKTKRFTKAIETYQKIVTTDTLFLAKIGHNIGNAYAMKEEYDQAKIYYKKSLHLHFDIQTQKNLEQINQLETLKSAQMTKKIKGVKGEENETPPPSSSNAKSNDNTSSQQTSQGSSSKTEKKSTETLLGQLSNKKPPSMRQFTPTPKGSNDEKPW